MGVVRLAGLLIGMTVVVAGCSQESGAVSVGSQSGSGGSGGKQAGDGDGDGDGDGPVGKPVDAGFAPVDAGADGGAPTAVDAAPGADASSPAGVDPCDTQKCGGFVFGDDLPKDAWLEFSVIADQAAFDADLDGAKAATSFGDQSHLHVTDDGTVLLWDAAVLLEPNDNSYLKIGEVLELDGDAFVQWKHPRDLDGELKLPDRLGEDELPIRAMDVRPGTDEVVLVSEWRRQAGGTTESETLTVAGVFASGGDLAYRRAFIRTTRLDWDVGDTQLSVDAYGRIHLFDQEAARIIAPNGGTLLDVEGWYWSNSMGFQVDGNGAIFLTRDDGGANFRLVGVSRTDGVQTPLVTAEAFHAAASSFVGEAFSPPWFGRYQSLGAGILGVVNSDAHTLVYAISATGEVRFLKDIGGEGFIRAVEYHPDTGAMWILRTAPGGDHELLYNGR